MNPFFTEIVKRIGPLFAGVLFSLAAPFSLAAEAEAAVAAVAEASSSVSPPSPKYTLDAAVRQALATSPAVRIDEKEVDRRLGVREQAAGEFDWLTTLSTTTSTGRAPLITAAGAEYEGETRKTNYLVDVTRKLRNGVVIRPSVSVGVEENHPPSSSSPYGASQINLKIIIPVLRGLGTESSGAAEAAARGDWEVARLLYRHSLATRAFATAQTYWQAWASQAALRVKRDDERRAERLHEGIRVLVEARVFPPNMLLQSEANLRQKSTQSQEAELSTIESGFALGRTIGLTGLEMIQVPVPDQILPDVIATPVKKADDSTRLGWINRAYLKRADYLAVRKSEVPLRILTRQAQLDLKPRLDLSLSGGYAGGHTGDDLVAPLTNRITGPNGEIGLSLAWPAANTYQRGLLRSRRAELAQAELSSAQAQSDIAADVCIALEETRIRASTLSNAAASVAISRKAVEQEQRRLQTGEASVLDVINLENLLSAARLSQIESQSGYAIAVARLRFAIGEIFSDEGSDQLFQINDLTQLPTDAP